MLVVDEAPPPNLRRATHLGFEDFLEAIVRVALLAPLPIAAMPPPRRTAAAITTTATTTTTHRSPHQ